MSGDFIHVGRVECRYFAPRDLPAPELLRSRLDEVVQRDFAAALSAAFPSSFPADSDELWLIRRLKLNLDASGEWNPEQLAQIWVGRAARAIVDCMFSSDGDANVLHFPNRAAYLAQFVTDAAQGDAWSKWYYRSFAGLRLLASADALASALTRDRDLSLQALGHIAPAGFRRILSALLAQHAEIVWRRLAPAHAVPAQAQRLAEVCALWREGGRLALPTLQHRALWLLHSVCRTRGIEAFDGAFPAIRALSALEEARLLLRASAYEDLLSALKRSDRVAVLSRAGARLAEWMEPWSDTPEWAEIADSALRTNPTMEGEDEVVTYATCFGALFLLLPAIDEFPAEEAAPGHAVALRFAIFRRCCPAALRSHVMRDPLVREILNVKSDEEPELQPRLLHNLFKRWLSDVHAVSGEKSEQFLARGFSIDTDPLRGHWLTLDSAPESTSIARPDLEYLAPEDSQADRCLCLIARALLRNFAWRLPGFARSSLPHLWTNFLDIQARVQKFDDRCVVRLSRPPLHVVLSVTGMLSSTYRLGWIDSCEFCLFPET